MVSFIVNNKEVNLDLPAGEVVLDVLRSHLRLTGTKEGCREGDCGACMILLGNREDDNMHYAPVNSCLLPIGEVAGKHIVTIEGLNQDTLSPIQQAILDNGATQCGFCTPGIIISLTGFLLNAKEMSKEEAVNYVAGNICRCTGYVSIRRAAIEICKKIDMVKIAKTSTLERIKLLIKWNFLPEYFGEISGLLRRPEQSRRTPRNDDKKQIIVAGGTDLFVQKPEELAQTTNLTFLSDIKELKGVRTEKNRTIIGAATTIEDIKNSQLIQRHFDSKKIFDLISCVSIRGRATIAGNIVNASPIGDMSIFLLALDADVTLTDGQKRRTVLLKNFFKGYKKLDMASDEIVESFSFEIPDDDTLFNFEKVSRRTYLDIAAVNSAMQLKTEGDTIKSVHISTGGVAPIPFYLAKTCKYLEGKAVNDETISEAAFIAQSEVSPIDDVRGSAKYKSVLLGQLIQAHFKFVKREAYLVKREA